MIDKMTIGYRMEGNMMKETTDQAEEKGTVQDPLCRCRTTAEEEFCSEAAPI